MHNHKETEQSAARQGVSAQSAMQTVVSRTEKNAAQEDADLIRLGTLLDRLMQK